jgi:hypothetical protein
MSVVYLPSFTQNLMQTRCHQSETNQHTRSEKNLCKNRACFTTRCHVAHCCNRRAKCNFGLPSHLFSPGQLQQKQSGNFPVPPCIIWATDIVIK